MSEENEVPVVKEDVAREVVGRAKNTIMYMADTLYRFVEFDKDQSKDPGSLNDASDLTKAAYLDLASKAFYEAIDRANGSSEEETESGSSPS